MGDPERTCGSRLLIISGVLRQAQDERASLSYHKYESGDETPGRPSRHPVEGFPEGDVVDAAE